MHDGRRANARKLSAVCATYRARSVEGRGTLLNVSEAGLFVETHTYPRVSEHVHIEIELATQTLGVQGIVCWVGERADCVTGFGVRLPCPTTEFMQFVASVTADEDALHFGVRRAARRIQLLLPVAIQYGNLMDTGHLADVSLTGARLEGTRLQPEIGSMITLSLAVEGHQEGLELTASVMRSTESNGYGIQIQSISEALSRSVKDVLRSLERLPVAR